jgi:predicted phosphodiesterase
LNRLDKLFLESKEINITNDDKIVIFSDLHLGNGRRNDDFKRNSESFIKVLKDYYLKNDFTLILNGDVEELYKFTLKTIKKSWSELYTIFDEFNNKGKLFKIFGNHDYELAINKHLKTGFELYESLKLKYNDNDIFIYHGHQTGSWIEQYSKIALFFIKYLFRQIENKIEPIESHKVYKAESNAYCHSKMRKSISILGHTHRPLFESHSKLDSLKLIIEKLIDRYSKSFDDERKLKISNQINRYKSELDKLISSKEVYHKRNSLYEDGMIVPCLFNSGSITGKHGFTGLEIKNGKIALIYWFDILNSQRYLDYKGVKHKKFQDTNFHKAILKKDSLDYLFSRIKLLC